MSIYIEDKNGKRRKFAGVGSEKDYIDDGIASEKMTWSSEKILDTLCPPFTETGNPITCNPVENYPLAVAVTMEPIQAGDGDPSPENVRPITGRDSVQVTRCGKNLLNGECVAANIFNKGGTPGLTNANGTTLSSLDVSNLPIHVEQTLLGAPENDGAFQNGYIAIKTPQEIPDDTEMTISLRIRVTSALSQELNHWVALLKGVEAVSPKIPVNPTSQEVQTITLSFKFSDMGTAPPEDRLKQLEFRIAGMSFDILEIQLEVGSTPTPYEPYQPGTTATLTLPETIYGGTVDAVSGVGGEEWFTAILTGNEAWAVWGADRPNSFYTDIVGHKNLANNAINVICSNFKYDNGESRYSPYHFFSQNPGALPDNVRLCFTFDETVTNVELAKQWITAQYTAETPVTICYKLATPEPFQATGNRPLSALPGTNTLYTDGNSLTVSGSTSPISAIESFKADVQASANQAEAVANILLGGA